MFNFSKYFTLDKSETTTEKSERSQASSQKQPEFAPGQTVDFVLAYEEDEQDITGEKNEMRKNFESNLISGGLILYYDLNAKVKFVLIHAPKNVLKHYAEILRLRFPIKNAMTAKSEQVLSRPFRFIETIKKYFSIGFNYDIFPPEKYTLTYTYSRSKDYLFDSDNPNFFKASVKSQIIDYILERTEFGPEDYEKGLIRLLLNNVFKAAYPLHENLNDPESRRYKLFHYWASVSKWLQYQPIDEIRDYLGIKYALYFSWLGFYTSMLVPASIVGVICFCFGIFSLANDVVSSEICHSDFIMCPRCDKYCDYWKVTESCIKSKIELLIDNTSTIFFAIFMSFWTAIYLNFWKRHSAEITHRWGLTDFDLQAEPPRPEFLKRMQFSRKTRVNTVTQQIEPFYSFWSEKLPSLILSFSLIMVFITATLAVVLSVILYKMTLYTSKLSNNHEYRTYAIPVTAACMNVCGIKIFDRIYSILAEYLTKIELHRTHTEYVDSLAFKIYLFQCVNLYSSIFYIAFIKGKYVGYPGDYNRIFGYRQEECNPGGCLIELSMQLGVIMIGNQTLGAILENTVPVLSKLYKRFKMLSKKRGIVILDAPNQWTEDYHLVEMLETTLFGEYLEMVIQYGFVTIFVSAFPLAPLFALINNVLEMRLDAKKFLKYYRRPIASRVKDIGVWMPIMAAVGRISVISNALILAFSSNFIPKLVYFFQIGNHSYKGFLNHSLSFFDTKDFLPHTAPIRSKFNVTHCRYNDYRYPYWDPLKYQLPKMYWHILAARLAFLIAFQSLVSICIGIVHYMVPDMPKKVQEQIKKESYRTTETILRHELLKFKSRARILTEDPGRRNSFV